MNKSADLIFAIGEEIKRSYETPVIFVTRNNFSAKVFNTLCNMHLALVNGVSNSEIFDIIVDYHLTWFKAIKELIEFKVVLKNCPRESIHEAIRFTLAEMCKRYNNFKKFVDKHSSTLSAEQIQNMTSEIEIIEEMNIDTIHFLQEKLKYYENISADYEFFAKLLDTVNELLNYVDVTFDSLTYVIKRFVDVKLPHATEELSKTLKDVVEELTCCKSHSAQRLYEEIMEKGTLTAMLRTTSPRYLEMNKLYNKIYILEDRIRSLEGDPDQEKLLMLQQQKEYLEKKLSELENQKLTIKQLYSNKNLEIDDNVPEEELCCCADFFQFRIFNHLLPETERQRLVTKLCYLWDLAIFGEAVDKSTLSVISAEQEQFSDIYGTYYVDDNGRKIYQKPEDDALYQLNEINELVPLSDDQQHIYYYDSCGRYYFDSKNGQKIYNAKNTFSEYMMDAAGDLIKIKEIRDGVVYYFDNLGRYHEDDSGKRIYREEDATSEYEHDGLGNLVRIRSQLDIFDPCPDDVQISDDCKYLQTKLGPALRECIADVIIHQPSDPILFLSGRLMQYRQNLEAQDQRGREKEQLKIEREIKAAELEAQKAAQEEVVDYGSEASTY